MSKKLAKNYLNTINVVHFLSDNGGHFRSKELQNHIVLEMPFKNIKTTINYFFKYHEKTELDGHFGLLQRIFIFNEKK